MFTMFMRLLVYLPPPYPTRLAGCYDLAAIYYAHTIAGPSVLVPSPPTYLVGLTPAYMYMYCMSCLNLSGFGKSPENGDP